MFRIKHECKGGYIGVRRSDITGQIFFGLAVIGRKKDKEDHGGASPAASAAGNQK